MKKLYFLFFFTIGLLAKAQIVNIPNANFKAKLLSSNSTNYIASTQTPIYGSTGSFWSVSPFSKIDTNGDGEIQVTEAQVIKFLNISNSTISDLTGIEAFTNLIYLNCSTNQLSSLDFLSLTNLKGLDCSNNQLSSLDVSTCLNLQTLSCSTNQLSSLDVLSLTNLESLNCSGNQLSSLDVSNCLNLQNLDCIQNQLSSLDLSNCLNLIVLYCYENQLSSLDVSQNVNLMNLICRNNQLTSLDVSQSVNLQNLSFDNNQLSSIDVSQNVNLESLSCGYNQLSSLDVSQNANLYSLYCYYNQLSSLDLSQNVNFSTLSCSSNQLLSLNIKNGNAYWVFLVFSDNPNLQYICADEDEVTIVQQKIDTYGYNSSCHINSYCSFTPGGAFYEISGTKKMDSNANGCDVNDINYPNLIFNITDGINLGTFIASAAGDYYIPVSAGDHTITPNLENPSYFNISPTSFTVDFPTQTSPFTQDFCVTANGVKSDVEVILLPTTPARPGFDATYKLVYRNKGNQVENGTISLTFDDSRLDYVAANPVYNSSAVNNFTWNYTNLQPFESREIILTLNVNSPMEVPAVNNGDQLDFLAQITPFTNDEMQYDNISALKQIVVGSYDPNDKTCIQGETIEPSQVGNYVHYVIRFENTGTFPAENIVVKDMIDLAKFDIATLVPLKSSHDFFTRISGNKVEFIFENINLDFNNATNDGYVVFKIKTKPTLVLGNTFSNNANIYFDYNFPITTNTYTTTVAALSTQDFDFGTYFTLYPNPAKDVLNIQAKEGLAVNSVEIYNQLGQIVMATTNAVNSVDVANLASGTYFVKVNTEKGSANVKFVKE